MAASSPVMIEHTDTGGFVRVSATRLEMRWRVWTTGSVANIALRNVGESETVQVPKGGNVLDLGVLDANTIEVQAASGETAWFLGTVV